MTHFELQQLLPIFYVFIVPLGLIFGSFLTVVVHRYPIILQREWRADCREYLGLPTEPSTKFTLARPQSRCPTCNTPIKPYHNIPVLGYLFLRGKCAHCKARISPTYLLVELTTLILSILVLYRFQVSWQTLAALYFTYVLIALFFIDFATQLLPDTITLSTLWLGLLLNTTNFFTTLTNAVLSAAAGYFFLWLVSWLFLKIRRKQGMGHGDFKMLAMVGAWFGFEVMLNTFVIATIIGTLTSILLLLSKKAHWEKPIPFGPFIALGAWVSMMAGSFALNWFRIY